MDATLDFFQVETMHGLTQLHHYIIGDVHHRVDGAYATAAQFFLHPQGGLRI